MTMYKCIYCLQVKDHTKFNREHVVLQMMGKYQNGFVLNDFQVCQECNSYFSKYVENKIALDSFEAFLRMQYRNTPISDGRRMNNSRIRLIGEEGVFKGVHFIAITDKSNSYHIHYEAEPMVGIINSIENHEYNYYSLDELPKATTDIIKRMKESTQPIINTGIDRDLLDPVLIEKGYLFDNYTYFENSVSDL